MAVWGISYARIQILAEWLRNINFVWDFGPGSKTDDLECKCCHFPFRFNRKDAHSHQGDHTPQTPKSGGGGGRPKSKAKPGKQTKEKESERNISKEN